MNTLQRPLFDAPMPMVEGSGITSMAMEESAGEKLGADLTATIAQGVAETESAIDAADDNVGIMNALRGKQASEEEYRTELASYVGRKDANATPESVLALVQPTIAMMELGEAPMGGIGDMMPPQTFGVEEEVFGKLPVQKLQAGGLAGRVAGIQALQKQFLPSEEQIQQAFAVQQPTTAQNLLAVGAPFVQGLLAPSQQGGGLNAALSLASQAASQQIAAQRETEQASKQRIAQALLNQQMQSGQSALTAGLAQEEKALDRKAEVEVANAKQKTGSGPESPVGKLIYDLKREKDPKNIKFLKDRLQNMALSFNDKQAILQANLVEKLGQQYINAVNMSRDQDLEKGARENYDALAEEYNERSNQAFQVTNLLKSARELAARGGTGVAGDFKAKAQEAMLFVKELAPELSGLTERVYENIFQREFKEGEVLDQRSARFGLQAINAQLALAFTKFFPGNLNAEEVKIAKRAASGDFSFSDKDYGILLNIFERQDTQLQEVEEVIENTYNEFMATNETLRSENKLTLGNSELLRRTKDAIRKVNKKYRRGSKNVSFKDLQTDEKQSSVQLILPTDDVVLSTRAGVGLTPKNRLRIAEQLSTNGQPTDFLLTPKGKDQILNLMIRTVTDVRDPMKNLGASDMKKTLESLLTGLQNETIAYQEGKAGDYEMPTRKSLIEIIKARLGDT